MSPVGSRGEEQAIISTCGWGGGLEVVVVVVVVVGVGVGVVGLFSDG